MKNSHIPEKEKRERRKALPSQLERAEAVMSYPFLVQAGYFLEIVQIKCPLLTSGK